MFRNKWRKITFYLWGVSVPLALVGGLLKGNPSLHNLGMWFLAIGLLGASIGLVLLKALGGRAG